MRLKCSGSPVLHAAGRGGHGPLLTVPAVLGLQAALTAARSAVVPSSRPARAAVMSEERLVCA